MFPAAFKSKSRTTQRIKISGAKQCYSCPKQYNDLIPNLAQHARVQNALLLSLFGVSSCHLRGLFLPFGPFHGCIRLKTKLTRAASCLPVLPPPLSPPESRTRRSTPPLMKLLQHQCVPARRLCMRTSSSPSMAKWCRHPVEPPSWSAWQAAPLPRPRDQRLTLTRPALL